MHKVLYSIAIRLQMLAGPVTGGVFAEAPFLFYLHFYTCKKICK